MLLDKYIPKNARQIRYIHAIYEHDDSRDESYLVNEDTYTDVWYECIKEVHRNKIPIYFRRRTNELASQDVKNYNSRIANENNWKNNFANCIHVLVKKVGRRILFVHDTKYTYKAWVKGMTEKKLDKILPQEILSKRLEVKSMRRENSYHLHLCRVDKQFQERRRQQVEEELLITENDTYIHTRDDTNIITLPCDTDDLLTEQVERLIEEEND
jgi:hypothetical protein